MKTIYSLLFLMLLLLTGHTLTAQLPQLIGTTNAGGANNLGVIYKSNLDGTGFTPVYSLSEGSGYRPQGKLVKAGNELLYGANLLTYAEGGAFGDLYSYDPVNNIYKVVFDFRGDMEDPAAYPNGLLLANNGLLYGTTSGVNPILGTLFSFNPTNNVLITLLHFSLGDYPYCTLIQGSDEKLYGTTSAGGANGTGVIFSFTISSNTYTKLADFPTGVKHPYGALLQGSNGSFYGFAEATNGYNLVYVYKPTPPTISVIHNFGKAPPEYDNFLVRDNFKAELYGASVDAQHGELFNITTTDNTYHVEHAFTGTEGADPNGLLNINNNLYGVTVNGGNAGYGTIYERPSIGSFKTLYRFTGGASGMNPTTSLIEVSCTTVPAKPGVITGNTAPVCNTTKKYSINRVSGATSYVWTVPAGAKINGVANDTVVSIKWGKQSGFVGVKASNACGLSIKRTLKVTVTCSSMQSAITNSETVSGATVTPNPTTGNVVVHFTSSTVLKYTLRVVDIAGRVLLTQELNTVVGNNITQLNLSKLAKGIYYIQLNGEANKQNFKVVLE